MRVPTVSYSYQDRFLSPGRKEEEAAGLDLRRFRGSLADAFIGLDYYLQYIMRQHGISWFGDFTFLCARERLAMIMEGGPCARTYVKMGMGDDWLAGRHMIELIRVFPELKNTIGSFSKIVSTTYVTLMLTH